jgi:uncharacterized protein (TIGR01619 family)
MHEYDYTENWDSFPSPVDGERVGFFFIDLGLAEIAPVADKPNLVRLRLSILQPDQNGLPGEQESTVLNEMEDMLVTVMASQFGGIYPGRVTVEGERSFYFYLGTKSSGYEKTLARVMADFPEYAFECRLQEDPEWKNYLDFLYPEPVQLQSMQNRRVVYQLMQHGDSLTVPRPVEHWIYFKTKRDREAWWNKVNDMGFELLEMSTVDEDDEHAPEYPYSLHITRDDKVDYDSIDECVLPLWGLAAEHNGNYDGWETGVVQEGCE